MNYPVLALCLLALGAAPGQVARAQSAPAAATTTATRLSGQVLDGAGRPLPGVNVFLKGTFDGATTDSLGRFAFRTRAAGPRPLVCTLVGYQLQEELLALPAGGGELALPVRRLRESRAALGEVVVAAGAFEASDSRRAASRVSGLDEPNGI